MLIWAGSLRFTAEGRSLDSERGLAGIARTFGGLAGAAVISQVVLTSSPIALALTGGEAANVTSLFAALAIFRAPYLLLLGVTARITGTLTRAVIARDERRLRQARHIFAGGAIALALGFGVFGLSVGQSVLRVLFGPTVVLGSSAFAWLGVGSGLAMGGILLVLLLLARGRSLAALTVWLVALGSGALVLALSAAGEVSSVVAAFVVAELVAVGLLSAVAYKS
jgi:hypothetical protein